ncbi:MAG: hypothetical protein O6930_05140, partial [Gammaproteobacteria bacterium]|nr:hypothetical protein [Gammaproteobacteria bacterium]
MDAIPPTATLQRLEAKLRRLAGKAIADYHMIQEGDRVMVCGLAVGALLWMRSPLRQHFRGLKRSSG